ncbi:DUF4876 domain-containing protein [Rufibacter immobilis]|uniref:DUF4876 domain-containing protein n=1 Tax=Rufibacter immobilis TaxID=1348778 RepID=A0A3M9MWB1_9BACT|nr:DUF4876 domain-containing protein [Rufibacter immobilis]RNI29816.1 DUF4876 domain-containing protein [Rufibacter immobilis]
MKQLKLFLLALLPLFLLSCEEDDSPLVQPTTFEVAVKFGSAYAGQVAPNLTVKVTNADSKISTEATTNSLGIARFENLPVGIYDISVSRTYTPAQFLEFAGVTVESDVIFNASLTNQTINTSSSNFFALELKSSPVGSLLIKQIYYAGSNAKDGALYRDQFIEIYNNSDQVAYADGLCFGQVYGLGANAKIEQTYLQPNGQYNWNAALNMPSGIDANGEYVYMESFFELPGTGTQYPIEPGKSIVIAQNALNHKAPYQNQKGETITPNDPSLTVDLSGADFEAFYNQAFNSDIDNPAVPNIILHQTYGKDMLLDNPGRDAYVLVKKQGPLSSLKQYSAPEVRTITATTKLYYQIPNTWVIDAVEAQQSPAKLIPKKLTDDLDAGYTYTPLGSYSSQSVIRKVVKNFNGRNILQDTNNSTNDFKVLDRAQPRGF